MSFLGFTVGSGIRSYDTFPSAVVQAVEDWGWSLLPSVFDSVEPRKSSGGHAQIPDPEPIAVPGLPPISVGHETGSTGQAARVYSVLPGPEPARRVEVPREIVVVGDVATEVERHPEGDFPAGSIFAPGRAWEPEREHGLDTEVTDVAIDWGGIVEWGLETLTGQQAWQTLGAATPGINPMYAAAALPVPVPSGVPGQPTTIYGYKQGVAVTSQGDNCGNRRYVTLDRETGKISCKRRRRRRLLTNRDLADLASLKTITGGGAALNSAVIRAVR